MSNQGYKLWLIALQLLDFLTTFWGLKSPALAEGNPLIQILVANHGLGGVLLAKMVLIFLIVTRLHDEKLIRFGVLVVSFVVLWNLYAIGFASLN